MPENGGWGWFFGVNRVFFHGAPILVIEEKRLFLALIMICASFLPL
jgi:hypothetical protein